MQPPGCVENNNVSVSGEGGFAGIESHRCGVAADLVLYNLHADTVGPDCQLLYRRGAECIAGSDDDIFPVLA